MKIQLSHYTKQRVIKRIVDVIMIAFLIVTLFPIGWMVYSSFKDNTDILSGRILLSRADNAGVELSGDKEFIYVCTADGAINKIDKKSKKIVKHNSIKSMATSFVVGDDYIWVVTGDKGLSKFSKKDLKKIETFSYPAKNMNISKIASSVVVKEGDKLLVSLELKGFEKVMEFDTSSSKFTRIIDIDSRMSPFQVLSMKKHGNKLLIGGNKGLLVLDLAREKIVSAFPIRINNTIARIWDITTNRGQIYLGTSLGAIRFDLNNGKILQVHSTASGLLSNQVGKTKFYKSYILFGTNRGLSIFDSNSGKVHNFEKLFKPVSKGKNIEKGLTSGNVLSLLVDGNTLILGTTAGRLSYFDLSRNRPADWFELPEGHLLVRWRNYVDMWHNINFGLYLRNSFVICGITMLMAMIFATTAAYAFSRFRFPGSNVASNLILATQMIPAIMYLIPLYIMFVKFTILTSIPMKGTFFGIILIYSAFFIPFSIWILRGFFAAIPVELEEAAKIDGCSPFQVFWYVVLPLAVPGIVATGVYVFLTAWDELMFAWVLTNADTMTIPVGIRLFVGNYQNRFDLMMAAATVATIPVIVLFFMLQKYIVKGLTAGAVKG
ncbi:ABC transporter permease subunit [Candidatus Margulisiibacteriota bacterium]